MVGQSGWREECPTGEAQVGYYLFYSFDSRIYKEPIHMCAHIHTLHMYVADAEMLEWIEGTNN